ILLYIALVETVESDFPAIRAPEERLRERKLLFVHPVGTTIDNLIVLPIGRNLCFRTCVQVGIKQVVITNEGNLASLGRKRSIHLLSFLLRNRCNFLGFEVVYIVICLARAAVNCLLLMGNH